VQVQYADYQLEDLSVLKRLKPGNYSVDAYWLDGADGTIGEVYLYQGGQYVGRGAQIATFTTARAEWTEADTAAMTEQSKYITKFDKYVREGKANVANVEVLPVRDYSDLTPDIAPAADLQKTATQNDEDLEILMEKYSAADYREYAIERA